MVLARDTMIGHYQIRSLLGAGGMGEVYLASDLTLHRNVALKVLHAGLTADESRLQRFKREAYAASSLNHPNILTIHEIGCEHQYHFMVTEFVNGESLGQCLRRRPFKLGEVLEIGIQVASALAAAHSAGVIHRDIKPDNIMLRRDHLVKVLDFGLAKLIESEHAADMEITEVTQLTSPGVLMGTARYMSPEQARGLPLDARTDIWSLGAVLYELVTKHTPFTGKTLSDVIAAVLTTQPPPLITYAPNVPAELERIIAKTLCKREDERYQTTKDLGLDLKALKQRLDFEAELERSGEKLKSDEAKRIVTSRGQAGKAETLLMGDTTYIPASHPQAASADQVEPNRESGLTRLIIDTDSHPVAKTQSETLRVFTQADSIAGRLSKFVHQRWKVLMAVAMLSVVASAGFFLRAPRSVKLTDKDTVVLAAFSNTTGDPVFDDSLPQGLATVLQQSPFLSLLPERKVQETLKLMGRSPEESLTTEIAEEICQRTGSKAVLAGSIASLGNEYVISLSATECQTGVSMARQQVRAAKREQVLDALGHAATSLRETVGESLSTIQKYDTPIAQATTPSLVALKAYSLGLKTMNQQGDSGAIPHFKRAIEIDPNFALAYAKLGVAYDNLRESELARENYQKAFELRGRVNVSEEYVISAYYYNHVTGEIEKANQTYELFSQAYPRNWVPHNNLGNNFAALGLWDKALSATLEANRLNPDSGIPYGNLVENYCRLNRFAEAKETYQRALANNLEYPDLHYYRYAVAFLEGDAAEMQIQINWATGKLGVEDVLLSFQSDTEAFSGHLEKARDLSRRAVESAKRSSENETAAVRKLNGALREAEFGNAVQARSEAAAAIALASTRSSRVLAALVLARIGDSDRAQSMVNELQKQNPLNTRINVYWLPSIRAAIEISRKNPTKAIEILRAAVPYELGVPGPQPGIGVMLYPAYLRGQAYLMLNQGTAAAAEFQKFLDNRTMVINFPLGALARLGLARALVLEGDSLKASAAYQDFLAQWGDGDPEIPILKQARAEFARL